jgi:hypothetical protein
VIALVLTAAAVAAFAAFGDGRVRRRLRRAAAEVAPGTATPGADRRRRRARPAPSPIPSPLLLELLAALLESGAPPPTALRHLAAAMARTGDSRAEPLEALALDLEQGITGAATDPEATAPAAAARVEAVVGAIRRRLRRAGPLPGESPDAALAVLRDAVRMAALAGLPPAALVRRAAAEERRRVGAIRRRAIRRLEVILVLPVGLCLLPAFVLLGVVPVVIDLFGG